MVLGIHGAQKMGEPLDTDFEVDRCIGLLSSIKKLIPLRQGHKLSLEKSMRKKFYSVFSTVFLMCLCCCLLLV